jgi:flagellar biogenesis protein FliO
MLGAAGALAVTLGLLFIGLHLLRRMHGVAAPGRGIPLEILQRVSTGPRQGVALLRVDDRVLVVALAEKGCTLLTELSEESAGRALAAQRTPRYPQTSDRASGLLGAFGPASRCGACFPWYCSCSRRGDAPGARRRRRRTVPPSPRPPS